MIHQSIRPGQAVYLGLHGQLVPLGPETDINQVTAIQLNSDGTFSALMVASAGKVCPECNGTKEYRGLNVVEPCRACCPEYRKWSANDER